MKNHTKTSFAIVVIMCLVWLGCKKSDDTNDGTGLQKLTLVSEHVIDLNDPSALALSIDGTFLWTVSDAKGGNIYRISFQGEVLGSVNYIGDDMEGIAVRHSTNTLFVAEEKRREVLELDKDGKILRSTVLDIEQNFLNDGLEGITLNETRNEVYVINEKNPMIFVTLDLDDLSIKSVKPVDFEGIYLVTDISGIFYVAETDEFWILSDESKKIVVTDYALIPQRVYITGLGNGEGIAVDYAAGRVYVADDNARKLFVYSFKK
jgi:uncharacterized protein YjiK